MTTAALLLALVAAPPRATASTPGTATAGGTSSVTTVSWGVAPTAQTATSAPPCLTLPASCGPFTATSALGLTSVYFDVWNTGTVVLTGLSYAVSLSSGTFTLTACSVAWGTLGTCSGTSTAVLTSRAPGTYPVTVGVPVDPGAGIYLKMATSLLVTSVTVSTAACSGGAGCSDGTTSRQIRGALSTNA